MKCKANHFDVNIGLSNRRIVELPNYRIAKLFELPNKLTCRYLIDHDYRIMSLTIQTIWWFDNSTIRQFANYEGVWYYDDDDVMECMYYDSVVLRHHIVLHHLILNSLTSTHVIFGRRYNAWSEINGIFRVENWWEKILVFFG